MTRYPARIVRYGGKGHRERLPWKIERRYHPDFIERGGQNCEGRNFREIELILRPPLRVFPTVVGARNSLNPVKDMQDALQKFYGIEHLF